MPYYIKQKVKRAPEVFPRDNYMINVSQEENFNAETAKIEPGEKIMSETVLRSPNPFGDTDLFFDFGIQGTFQAGETYFLNFKIKQPIGLSDALKYKVLLKENNNGSTESQVESEETANPPQQIGSFIIKVATTQDSYIYYSTVFTPRKTANFLVLRLTRTVQQATSSVIHHLVTEDNTEPQNIDAINSAEGLGIYKLRNLVNENDDQASSWIKLGFQSRPGTMIVVNKQLIRVGRSGIFQLDKVEVDSFMLASPHGSDWTTIDAFLLDYAYNA